MSCNTPSTVLDPSDTIVAVASRPGPAARGVVRLSGPASIAIASDGFEPSLPPPSRPEARVGQLRLGPPLGRLPATLVLWPGPRSYTGQAVAEIHAVGSPPILRHLVDRSLARGARLAEPGEFTLRAFLSGRIDLEQSEAVLGVIEATSPRQLDDALRRLSGGLAGPVRALRDRLLDRLVDLEANLDFVEESDVAPVARRGLVDDLVAASAQLADLIARRRDRDRSESRPRVVLAGRPNAGKSRLFNALIGRDRAIVSPVAGTTRDDLDGLLDCDGLPIELVDTAGEGRADSAIDAAAQGRRERRVAEADLVLLCVPVDSVATIRGDDRTLVVATKADLRPGAAGLAVSAATGDGLDRLRSAIGETLRGRAVGADPAEGLGSAWREGLDRAAESLGAALAVASGPGGGEELIAAELRQAIDDLGSIVGAVVSEDILDRIFRRFCVGK